MASVISQLVSVVQGTLVKASVWNNEILQLVNLVSGVSSDKRMKVVCDDDTNGALTVSQSGDGPVADFQASGTTVMKVPVLGVPVDATDITDKAYVDGKKTQWIHTVFDNSPSLTSGDATPFAMWHVPNADSLFFVERVSISYADSVAGTDADSFTFKLRKSTGGAAATDLATVVTSKTLNPTSHVASGTLVTASPVALASNDTLFFIWSAQSAGTDYRLRKITLAIHGYSTPE